MTKKKWSFKSWKRLGALSLWILGCLIAQPTAAYAGTPDWLRAAARSEMPKVTEETAAVVLLDEMSTTVNSDGDVKEVVRRAYKILRPQGQEYGTVRVYFDSDTRLDYLRAWSIPSQGPEYEVKDKDKEMVETTVLSEALYEDVRVRVVRIPAASTGSVIGYEYARRSRPRVLQTMWLFQHQVPTKRARLILQLPSGWTFESYWRNYQAVPASSPPEHRVLWELNDIPALEKEESMPAWGALAACLNLAFHPASASRNSWSDVGNWYTSLTTDRLLTTPEITAKVRELTASVSSSAGEKLRAVVNFVQQNIRYVAIETGIGGYQPHAASEIFGNRYGDCKDKATLLKVMLREIGLDSYYLLVNSERGVVAPDFPSVLNFDHVIVAIHLPQAVIAEDYPAIRSDPKLGRLLFFDPTDYLVPLGYLPSTLQGADGLLIHPQGSELLHLPVSSPNVNRLLRAANLALAPDGSLSGTVREIRSGGVAAGKRASWRSMTPSERQKDIEDFVSGTLGNAQLSPVKADGLDDVNSSLVIDYSLAAPHYAQNAGSLLLFRPRVLGSQALNVLESKPRQHPIEFANTSSYSDLVEIRIPPGYVVDEVSPAVDVSLPVMEYHSKVNADAGVVHYTRTFMIKEVQISVNQMEDIKKLFRQIADDERSTVILKHVGQ